MSGWAAACLLLYAPLSWGARGLGGGGRPLQHPAAPLGGAVPRRRRPLPALPASAGRQQRGGAAVVGVGVGVVRRSVRAGVDAAVSRRPLQVASSPQAVGLGVALVAAGASARSHLVPLVAVAVAAAGSRAGQSVAARVAGVRAVRLPEESKEKGFC